MRAILFDMDGTLLDSEGLWMLAPVRMLEHFGVQIDDPLRLPWLSTSCHRSLVNYFALPESERAPALRGKTLAECDAWCRSYMYDTVYPAGLPQLKPGALEALAAARELGLPMCVLSVTREDALRYTLERTGMARYFSFYISTNETLNKKSPEIFHVAARRLGFEAADCLVAEDSLYAMTTARAAGCTVWALRDPKHVKDVDKIRQTAHRYFDTLFDFTLALREACAK